jgi:MFS family permease
MAQQEQLLKIAPQESSRVAVHKTPDGAHPFARWIILALASTAGLLASIQSTALIIAFEVVQKELNATFGTLLWIILAFILVATCVVPAVGPLGEAFGKACLFKLGFILFTISALLAGLSKPKYNGNDLVGYRVVMGLGAAFLFTNSMSIVTVAFAPYGQVGLAQGVFQMAFASGAVLGPVVGGALAKVAWRWIFLYNVPAGAIACIFCLLLVHDPPPRGYVPSSPPEYTNEATSAGEKFSRFLTHQSWRFKNYLRELELWRKQIPEKMANFNYLGASLAIICLVFLMLLLVQIISPTPAFDGAGAQAPMAIICAFAGILFVWDQNRVSNPLVPLSMFRNKVFSAALIGAIVSSFARNNITYALIFFLQGPFKEDPLQAGIHLIPYGLGIMTFGLVSGKLADVVGPRYLAMTGAVISAVGTGGLIAIDLSTNYWLLALTLFVIGCGAGLFNSPNSFALLTSVPHHLRGVASGLSLLAAFTASMFGIVMVFNFALTSIPYQTVIALFIDGGGGVSEAQLNFFLSSIRKTFYVTIAAYLVSGCSSIFLFDAAQMRAAMTTGQPAPPKQTEYVDLSHEKPSSVELRAVPVPENYSGNTGKEPIEEIPPLVRDELSPPEIQSSAEKDSQLVAKDPATKEIHPWGETSPVVPEAEQEDIEDVPADELTRVFPLEGAE